MEFGGSWVFHLHVDVFGVFIRIEVCGVGRGFGILTYPSTGGDLGGS